MTRANVGDTVCIEYALRTGDGQLIDASAGRPPIRFRLGVGDVIAGLDQAVIGMAIGESKTVVVPPALAHGLHRPERVLHFQREATVSPDRDHAETKHTALFTVTEWSDHTVSEDYNHPLAGKDLDFEITLMSIEAPAN